MATSIGPERGSTNAIRRDIDRLIAATADTYAQALARESELHALRGVRKSEAIVRLIGTDNAETGKPHSASSAEKVVESDAEYAAFLKSCRDSVVERIRREAEYEAAKMGAWLVVNSVRAEELE